LSSYIGLCRYLQIRFRYCSDQLFIRLYISLQTSPMKIVTYNLGRIWLENRPKITHSGS